MPGALNIVVVYNKTNTFGISRDAKLLAEALPIAGRMCNKLVAPVKLMDCREPPIVCDVCIHLEVPYAVWFSWAKSNAILINTEWWNYDKWTGYLDSFDLALFRDNESLLSFLSKTSNPPANTQVINWANSVSQQVSKEKVVEDPHSGFVWFLGGSANKRAAAEIIIPLWKESYPRLTICSLESMNFKNPIASNVNLRTGFLEEKERERLAKAHAGHICLSKAESYGYTAAEAEQLGAYCILNPLPCYKYAYMEQQGNSWMDLSGDLESQLETAVKEFLAANLSEISAKKQKTAAGRRAEFLKGVESVLNTCAVLNTMREPIPRHMPPLLNPNDCPPISVITLVHNRPKFIENACLNLLSTDYPKDKIEWIVVDDSDPEQSPSNRVIQFSEKFSPGEISYIPLLKKHTIGEKRNMAIEKAKHNIIVIMDDDDHYPSTSFRRRVAYLLKGRKRYECATCTTIAMYDLRKGTSAVNVPPYTLSLGERCSEASMVFTKNFWKARKFEDTNVSEGDAFLKGRENQVVEMPPQQMLVALNHGSNLSGRSMPDAQPSCFWGFPKPLLEFLHGLIGITVEAV